MSLMYIFIVHYTHCDAELFIQMQFESVVLYTTTDIIVDINHDTLTSQAGNPEHSTALHCIAGGGEGGGGGGAYGILQVSNQCRARALYLRMKEDIDILKFSD